MTPLETAELWDQHSELLHCVDPIFTMYGQKRYFYGEIITLKIFEDNSLVRKQLEKNGKGKVLVIDGGGSLRCALIGDKLATLAIENEWEGIIVNGCIRDSKQINKMMVGIKALNTSPVKSIKRNLGELNTIVKFAGIQFKPHNYLYSDEDGILISKKLLF